jgi:hypothetical protein
MGAADWRVASSPTVRGGVLKEESAEMMLSDNHLAKLKTPLHKDKRPWEVVERISKAWERFPRETLRKLKISIGRSTAAGRAGQPWCCC